MEKDSNRLEKLNTHCGDTFDPFSSEAQKMLEDRSVTATQKRTSLMSALPSIDQAILINANNKNDLVIGDSSDSDEEEKIDTSTGRDGSNTLASDKSEIEEEKKSVSFQIPQHSFDRGSGDVAAMDEDLEQYHK